MGFNSAFSPLNTELNPICPLLALLGAHHILHVSGLGLEKLKKRLVRRRVQVYVAQTVQDRGFLPQVRPSPVSTAVPLHAHSPL